MTLLITTAFVINLLMLISLIIGCSFVFKDKTAPKLRAQYAVYVVVLLALYLLFIAFMTISFAYRGFFKHLPILAAFFFAPFIIGKYANYEKLRFFTLAQIFAFFTSLIYIVYLYFNFKQV